MLPTKPKTTAQLEAASSWTREAGGASKAIGTVPAMRPRALLGASCDSNGSKEKTLKSGAVGSRVLAGQRLKQADFTFRDPSRGSGTTTHVPSADPRTLQLHLREFPFSPPSTPLFAPLQARTAEARRPQRAHTSGAHYPSPYVLHTEVKFFNISQENIACFLGSYFEEQCTRVAVFERACVYMGIAYPNQF